MEILNNQTAFFVFASLCLVIVILSVYLGFLYAQIKKQNRRREEVLEEIKKRERKKDEGIIESLRIIALAVSQNQCELSEGCIRIYKLMSIMTSFEKRPEYQVFEDFYHELKDFAYLEEREKLSRQEKFSQDTRRFAVEEKYHGNMIESCKVLLSHVSQLQ